MAWQRFAMGVLFMSLAVMLHYGNQIRAKVFPEITDYSESTTAATVQAMGKPSLLQPANQVAARSMDGHVTSRIAATTSRPETPITHTTIKTLATTSLVTTNSTPSTSPIISTLLTTLATTNNSHTAAPVTEATIGPSAGPSSPPPTITPPVHTTGTSPSTVSHTTGKTTQPSNQTTLPATLSTSPQNSTTSQKPAQPTHAPGPTTATHSTTQTASPTTTAPGPTLAPQPSSAKTGTYQVLNGSKLCIKAEMGIELTVQDTGSVFSPQRYFNIDPNATQASGNCDFRKSKLLLNFRGGFVNLTFTKNENSYYISEVGASLTVSNPEKIYHGMKSSVVMFETVIGHSFKCVSEQSIQLSTCLQLNTVNVQLQAFDFEDNTFGNVDECSSDYTIVLPVIGAIVLGLCAVGLIVYGVRLRREASGYQRI
ncbi:PREDICTED: lysosome-associated membrane glycoprotein 3 [Ceratotherium simum simum]|uniref:Lysosome-associated membrane glycoprotein 3 n=1 Tax=Ceratotherium simum simum TaxID=73337 RepID=A0ABM1CGF5_CERSS|nr:PREDICTED: lysosome-associated membrane glycoprotein 3 [Ceratotherium simum simum]